MLAMLFGIRSCRSADLIVVGGTVQGNLTVACLIL